MQHPYMESSAWDSKSFTTFYQAFLTCALWASTDDDGTPLDRHHTPRDIALVTRDTLYLECKDFYHANYDDLDAHGSMEQGGHDFFLTRCGHGAGFWDRGTGEVGERLTAAAKVYGSVDLYKGDDGTLYA
jgi:hypothetical protein